MTRSLSVHRAVAAFILIGWSVTTSLMSRGAAAQSLALPDEVEGVRIGSTWTERDTRFANAQELTARTTLWDRHLRDCGYRVFRMPGRPVLTVYIHDFTVTRISTVHDYESADALEEAVSRTIANYGPPNRTALRDLLGRPSETLTAAAYVTLRYQRLHPVEFRFNRTALERQTVIEFRDHRWHENRGLRCARGRDLTS